MANKTKLMIPPRKTVLSLLLGLFIFERVVALTETAFGGCKDDVFTQAVKSNSPASKEEDAILALLNFLNNKTPPRRQSLAALDSQWAMNLVPMIVESLRVLQPGDARSQVLWSLLEKKTGKSMERSIHPWFRWLWQQQFAMHPEYPEFKAALHLGIDERFRWWFYAGMAHSIRLDEILWGGVKVDGIPPLDHPKFISAQEAAYLEKKNVVFGVYLKGEARAYPKRILAWHELFNDTVGGVDVTCAYCTLCGAAVLYAQEIGERKFEFGTSGFLFRSNKLMYDRQTHSLWPALEGVPVTGKLTGSGLKLTRLPIITTTWEAWKEAHPQTTVLSLETGHQRDYGEGVAYRDYFATQDLMFPVPGEDKRLKNKQEVVALLIGSQAAAYDTAFLAKNSLYHDTVGGQALVILTDISRANRVYDAQGVSFSSWDRKSTLIDKTGQAWRVSEEALIGPSREERRRLPAHRAFWFGWHAQFPNSRLTH
ncbi:MAG: DUF3179 domain-containing protein [Acidobacteria bacterium]|nr:DUF3179 domain-containing protein [Acidobacteriota bacterium]